MDVSRKGRFETSMTDVSGKDVFVLRCFRKRTFSNVCNRRFETTIMDVSRKGRFHF